MPIICISNTKQECDHERGERVNGKYERPLILTKMTGEGVYLASGGGVNADYTVTRVQNEPSEYYPTARYQIKFNSLPSSSGQFQQEADAVLQVQGANVTAVAAEANCTVSNSGNTINVHLISWNNIAQIAVTCDSHIFTVN